MNDLLGSIGKNIKKIRKARGITQGELSESTEIAQSRLSKIENGQVEPMLSTLSKIAKTLNVSVIDFLQSDYSESLSLLQKLYLLEEKDRKSVLDMLNMALEKKALSLKVEELSGDNPSD